MNQLSSKLNRLLAQLEASGRRVTTQRIAICEALLAQGGHPTAAEVYQRVHAAHPAISQATVYNTLSALEQLSLIRLLHLVGDDHAHYDLGIDRHVNAVCTRCGRITDIHTDTLEALLGLVATRSGYHLSQGEGVIVYGLCPECASTQVAEA
ncbi:MAG: transcriptional repressor [Chloroflexota bacterium]|nr:transcriptional repressor [Chloroflexota bacterium]